MVTLGGERVDMFLCTATFVICTDVARLQRDPRLKRFHPNPDSRWPLENIRTGFEPFYNRPQSLRGNLYH